MGSSKKDGYFLKSLASGIKVMEFVADSSRPVTLSEIANHLETTKTTATRICHTFSELNILQRNEHNKYSLTPNVLKFGYASLCSLGWLETAKFYMEKLSNEAQETAALSILDGAEVMILHRVKKGDFFPFDTGAGTKLPAHCAAMGKVLIAFQPPKKRESILNKMTFRPLTVHSITSRKKYIDELKKVRQQGFAENYEEVSIGVCGVSAPITKTNGDVIASVSISSATAKYSKIDVEKILAPAVIRTAKQISEALAHMDVQKLG